jgi:hypothetical protein
MDISLGVRTAGIAADGDDADGRSADVRLPPSGDPQAADAERRTSSTSDVELVSAVARGVESAWDELVERYAQQVWSVCSLAALRPDEAAAVSAVVWMRLLAANAQLGDRPVGAWLIDLTARECAAARSRAGRSEDTALAQDGERRRLPRVR